VLDGLGATALEVRSPHDLAEVDAVVLPGGESTTISMLLESTGLFSPLSERLASGLPALGTCAGMILLAAGLLDGRPDQRTLGALDVDVRRNAYGRQIESFETDLVVDGLAGGVLHAVFIRAPIVERIGAGVEVLARVDGRPVLCRQGAVMASAFHPELVGDHRLHEMFLSAVESSKSKG
jgi:pyridoxal 5'-phosphate synthase pdxT subunit